MLPPRPLPFSVAPPPHESELKEVKKKIVEKEEKIAEKEGEVEAAAKDVRAKELLAQPASPAKRGRPARAAKELLESLPSARAKEQSLRDELAGLQGQLAALQGLLLEFQKKENLLLAPSGPGPSLAGPGETFS